MEYTLNGRKLPLIFNRELLKRIRKFLFLTTKLIFLDVSIKKEVISYRSKYKERLKYPKASILNLNNREIV
jgi:hypothetical protein